MYICELCYNQVGSGVSCNIITLETRKKTYPARPNMGDPGGFGNEIVKQARVCTSCKNTKRS